MDEALVMVIRVIGSSAIGIVNDSARSPITSTWRIDCVLAVIPFWKLAFLVPKDGSISPMTERPTGFDEIKGSIYFS